MKEVVLSILVALVVGSEGAYKYDGQRVRVGFSDQKIDSEYFFDVPRTINGVKQKGWRLTERPEGTIRQLRMYCSPGWVLCPLYTKAGFIAGVQLAMPVDTIDAELKPEEKFIKWTPPAADGEPCEAFWIASLYYFSPDKLKAGVGPTAKNNATVQGDAIWVTGYDGRLMKIPLKETELQKTLLKKQNCIPFMGGHYYYKATKDDKCETLLPWFVLVKEGKVIGCGLQTIGRKEMMKKPEQLKYFEDVPRLGSFERLTIPDGPDCLFDYLENYGFLSMHVYFINDPWTLTCEPSDSSDPETAPSLPELAAAATTPKPS